MEQRLAEFRARRQAVVRKDEETAARTMQDTDPPTDTTPTADTQQTEEEEASPQSSPSKVRPAGSELSSQFPSEISKNFKHILHFKMTLF